MSRYRKVVWNEGMLLTPHHFQQWDNYHEDLLRARLAGVLAYDWGVLDLQVNRETIANGSFSLIQCLAVMPDGLVVNIPDPKQAPPPRSFAAHFPPNQDKLEIFLAIPARRDRALNFQSNGDGGPLTRYVQVADTVVDETTGSNEQHISYAAGNFRILFGDESREGFTTLKIAELKRLADQPRLAERYVPPSLHIGASIWLTNTLRKINEILITKSSTLSEQRRQTRKGLADFNSSDVAVFWLLHTVNSAIPRLLHLSRTRLVHPERLYAELTQLAGSLMTFVTEELPKDLVTHPKDILAYDHDNLFVVFDHLDRLICRLLEVVIPTRCVAIPLERISQTIYAGRVPDDLLQMETAYYLAIQAQLPEVKLLEMARPTVVKIASRDDIEILRGAAVPGVAFTHISPAPAAIPARIGFHYFRLDSIGPFWEKVRGSKTIAVYVPGEFSGVKLEMYAIKP
ncbi:MAG: type VI secretion system baseplate subunit TssK [Blastocatellia bacterium]